MSQYRVIKSFVDLEDSHRLYKAGDDYQGKMTKGRLAALSTNKNLRGEPLIEEVVEEVEEVEDEVEAVVGDAKETKKKAPEKEKE